MERTSELLSLPPELHNSIYEDVVANTDEFSLSEEGIIKAHPLLLVCAQFRAEFTPMWEAEIIRRAKHLKIHIRALLPLCRSSS
jgi:hypothetical protein